MIVAARLRFVLSAKQDLLRIVDLFSRCRKTPIRWLSQAATFWGAYREEFGATRLLITRARRSTMSMTVVFGSRFWSSVSVLPWESG